MSQRDLIWIFHWSIRSYEYRAVGYGVDTPPSSSRIATLSGKPIGRYEVMSIELWEYKQPSTLRVA